MAKPREIHCKVWLDKDGEWYRLKKLNGDPLEEIRECSVAKWAFGDDVPTNPKEPKEIFIIFRDKLDGGH